MGFLATSLLFTMATARQRRRRSPRMKRWRQRGVREEEGARPPRWKFFPRNVAQLANASRPRVYTSSLLLPSAFGLCPPSQSYTRLLARATAPCDAFGAPCLVIRVIYAALIAPRRTITAVRVGRLSRPISVHTLL